MQTSASSGDGRTWTIHQPGEILAGRYRVESTLGQGGMGAVYLATHLQLDVPVAVKEMILTSVDEEMIASCERQFRVEARILNRLHHPNLPRVTDFFQEGKRNYLVMDYIRGRTLDDIITSTAEVPEKQVLEWARELCTVLDYLHRHDPPVIFRDLKPSNVMVADDGSIRLIDFGIAKVFEDGKSVTTDTLLSGAGSHGYAAPEQYQGGTDARSDIYALGATLYCALTHEVPPLSVMMAAGMASLKPLRDLRPDVSERTASTIHWMMHLHRDMRPADVSVVLDSLGISDRPTHIVSLPDRMRRLVHGEFQHLFPSEAWVPRPSVSPRAIATRIREARQARQTLPMVLIQGVSGMGKTRLMHEVGMTLASTFNVVPVRAERSTTPHPFGFLVETFRALLSTAGPELPLRMQSELEVEHLRDASDLLPDLRKLVPPDTPPSRHPLERTRRILEVLVAMIRFLAEPAPLILLVDDLQWADRGSLRLLDGLRQPEIAPHVSILMTLDTDMDAEAAVSDFIERWQKRGDFREHELTPLQAEEIQEYLQATMPPLEGLSGSLEALHRATGGSPLALEELVRFLLVRRVMQERRGILSLTDLDPSTLPHTADESIRRRMDQLPRDSQILLGQAAVVGKAFDIDVLQQLSNEPLPLILESLQRAWEGGFVRPDDSRTDGFMFMSEATRRAFYDRLQPAVRAQLHSLLGHIEEARSEDAAGIARTAFHFGLAGAVDRSLEHLIRLQQEFVAPRTVELVVRESWIPKEWGPTVDLDEEQFQQALKAAGMLMRTLKSLGTYGTVSPITQASFDTLLFQWTALLEKVGPLAISCTEEGFAINNRQLTFDKAPGELANILERLRISGFMIKPGLDRTQLSGFLDLLLSSREAIAKAGGWRGALQTHGITSVLVNETLFVEVAEKELFDKNRMAGVQEVVVRAPESHPAAPPPPLPPPVPAAMGLDDLLEFMGSAAVSPEELMGQLANIRQLLEDVRHGTVVARVVQGSRPSEEVADAISELMRQATPSEILRVVALVRAVDVPLQIYLQNRPEVFLQDLEHPDGDRRSVAVTGLYQMGADARRHLLKYLGRSDHPLGRAEALMLLCRLATDAAALLAHVAIESNNAEESLRALRALIDGKLAWQAPLSMMLHSPAQEVRRETAQLLLQSYMQVEAKWEILKEALGSEHPAVVADALDACGRLKYEGSVPTIGTLLHKGWLKRTGEEIRVQVQCCYALGRIGSLLGLQYLKVVLRKGISTQLMGNWDPAVRAAAVWAIAHLPSEESSEIVQRHLGDPDPAVRSAAKLGLELSSPG